MWRIYRKTIFPRWCVSQQNPVENSGGQKSAVVPKVLVITPYSQRRHSNEGYGKQHADKQDKKFWDDTQFQFHTFKCSLLETAGWLGTAVALCLNIHLKHIKAVYDRDKFGSFCIFRRNVYGMPRYATEERENVVHTPSIFLHSNQEEVLKDSAEPLEDIRKLSDQYQADLQNSVGVVCLKKNEKKAFRHFQRAARLGSSKGFYNLGLCYELGKGTKINLNRAAFCYRKAAAKGHGLAAFNLAVYFVKGLGGLPIDKSIAKVLLETAADKGVPEAQTYMGLEYLQEGRLSDAFAIFSDLAKSNCPDGKYYLGVCYENGWGTEKEEQVAAELFSQSASQGHQKATLRLATFYDEGRGGCDVDYDFAKALYQILIDQGSEESRHALSKLKLKEQSIMSDISSTPCAEKSKMCSSSSVPDLSTRKTSCSYALNVPTSPYLDLITPYLSLKSNEILKLKKTTFYIGESEPEINIPSHFLPNFQSTVPQLMLAKT